MGDHTSQESLRWPALIWIPVFAALVLVVGIGETRAGNMQRPEGPMVSAAQSPGPLDGYMFTGELGPVGKPADATDTWIFEDGSFVSKSCLQCGFPQSGYTAQVRSGEVEFKTKTRCPVSDAVIVWEGTVKKGEIEGVFTWTKKRWYRTVRKKFWFKGKLADTSSSDHDHSP